MGMKKSTWYLWTGLAALWDTNNNPGSLTAAGAGYQEAATWLLGANMQSSGCLDKEGNFRAGIYKCIGWNGTYIVNLGRREGYQGQVVWFVKTKTKSGGGIDWQATSTYKVPSGFTEYLDLDGNPHRVVNSTVTVGASPILLQNKRIFGKASRFSDPEVDASPAGEDRIFKP